MKSLVALALLVLVGLATPQSSADREDWVPLFNGKNLDGWTPKITGYPVGENALNTFRVEDGLLKVRYDEYDAFRERFGHLFHEDAFSYYVIAAEYRFVGDQVTGGPDWATRNSGIMVHGQPAATMQKDQDFPISIEVQLLGGLGKGPRTTANLCTPGTHVEMKGVLVTRHCVNSSSPTFDGDQWVRVEVHVHGGEAIRHVVNGQEVLAYQRPQIGGENVVHFDPAQKRDGTLLTQGSISLQSESHPVDFRKVELLDLAGCRDTKARNYKRYVLRDKPGACRY
jgi:hypothetical protein